MKTLVITLMLAMASWLAFPQNVIIFQPGPGANDGTDEGGINGGKDTYVYDEQYLTNYGNSVAFGTNPISTCNMTNLQAFLKFDVTTLPDLVDSVFVCFYMYAYNNYCYSNCDNTFDLRYITTPWNEMALTWSNMPVAGLSFSDTVRITFPTDGGLLRLNITEAYRSWKDAKIANEGFTIYPLDGTCNNACVSFAGHSTDFVDDTTTRPYLEVFTDQPWGISKATGIIPELTAYPNPVTDKLTIQFVTRKMDDFKLSVYDFSGRHIESMLVKGVTGNHNLVNINVSNYNSGFYTYRLTGLENHATGRFVVSKR